MAAISGGLGTYAVFCIGHAGDLTATMFDSTLMSISYARAAAGDFGLMQAALERQRAGSVAGTDLAQRSADFADALNSDLDIAAQRSLSPKAAPAAARVRAAVGACAALNARIPPGVPSPAERQSLDDCAADVADQIDVLVNLVAGQGFRDREQALAQIATSRRLNLLGTCGAVLLSVLITWLLARQLIGPVADASAAADRIAHGELDTPIPTGSADELGVLLAAMAIMRDNIRARMQEEMSQRRLAQTLLVEAIESSREAVCLVDAQGRIVIANSQCQRFFPLLAEQFRPGTPFEPLMEKAVSVGMMVIEDTALAGVSEGSAHNAEEARLADGRWLRISRSSAADGGFVAIASEITALKQREQELRESRLRLRAALDNMSQGLCLFDADDRLLMVNQRFCEIYSLAPAQVAFGTSLAQIVAASAAAGNHPGRDAETVFHDIRRAVTAQPSGVQLQELSHGRLVAVAHNWLADGGFVATHEDITERRRAEAQLAFMQRHDGLTRLPNRVLLLEHLEQALATGGGEGLAVVCLGLDRFKLVNDTIGRPAGDLVLQAVAERLAGCVRQSDIVARLGADEFAIILAEPDRPELPHAAQAAALARRVIEELAAPYDVAGERVMITTSVGIALAPADGDRAETLLANADIALSRAKADGNGEFRFFEVGMDQRVKARRLLELDLRSALADRQFEVFYQPLVDLKLSRLSGFEALIRWRHPVRGMVSPAEFIPLAEELGLIGDIGEWVLGTACREACAWPAHVKIAVNVSPLQFKNPRLVAMVGAALVESGLPAARLELEITESVLLGDTSATLAKLHEVHALGARISMDDFGTGYSSLGYLRSFPFDKIKIDQSFVRELAEKEDCRAIIRAVVGLGRDLRMRVTAEGVETMAQLAQLRDEGCDELQGYLFSRPVPASELPALLLRLERGAESLTNAVSQAA